MSEQADFELAVKSVPLHYHFHSTALSNTISRKATSMGAHFKKHFNRKKNSTYSVA